MLTFLFWNMGSDGNRSGPARKARQSRLRSIVGNLAREHQVDLVILAECPLVAAEVFSELNRGNPTYRSTGFRDNDSKSQCERILIFPRFPSSFIRLKAEGPHFTGRAISLPEPRPAITFFAVHFSSKMHRSDASQTLALPGFSETVRSAEKRANHTRTLVVGDLNMNPFEDGIVGAEGLNAVMARHVAEKEARTVDGKEHPFFYNPMWSHFGDSLHEVHPPGTREHQPPGTCYYRSAESKWYFWNMFDQVLLRPELLPLFKNKDLKILVDDGVTSFVDADGLPDRANVSDHLPILFRLEV